MLRVKSSSSIKTNFVFIIYDAIYFHDVNAQVQKAGRGNTDIFNGISKKIPITFLKTCCIKTCNKAVTSDKNPGDLWAAYVKAL